MAYQISTTQIDSGTGKTHLVTLTDLANALDWSAFYAKIYEYTASPDDNGSTADPNVRQWFNVATQANAGIGATSALIRDYTLAQIEIRTGVAGSASLMDDASDAIAASIWTIYVSQGSLPTLQDIQTEDAQNVVAVLQANGHNVGFEVWSGNVLFAGLGDIQPLLNNLIPTSSNSSYDLFAAGEALNDAGLGNIIGAGWNSALTFLDNTGSVFAANSATSAFLARLYGEITPLSTISLWRAQVGRQGSIEDLLFGTNSSDAIHGGDGNDIIVGSGGLDVIDGGAGFDTADFSSSDTDQNIYVSIGQIASDVQHSAQVTVGSFLTNINSVYDIERLVLNVGDDLLRWSGEISSETSSLRVVDAGENEDTGDTLDFSDADGSIEIDLESGAFSSANHSIEFFNFENVVGGNLQDTIRGDEEVNEIEGRDGADEIDGRGGNDTINGGANNDTIEGGGGNDSVYGGSGNDSITDSLGEDTTGGGEEGGTFFGGSGNDTVVLNEVDGTAFGGSGNDSLDARSAEEDATVVLTGGSGDDVLYGNGSSVLTGGSGADIFHVQTGDVVVDAEGHDELWYNGQRIFSADGTDVLLGMEAGESGNPNLVANFTTAYQQDPNAHLAIALVVNGLPEDFDGTYQGVSYTAYFYVNCLTSALMGPNLEEPHPAGKLLPAR
jgi:Ca2+-binding RTX toxin-like protein